MKRNGFTLVELLVVLAILAILVALIVPAITALLQRGEDGEPYYDTHNTGTYVCVKTYTVNESETSTSKRVDVRPVEGGMVETFACDDDWRAGIKNSATLYAQFQAERCYEITTVGFRKEGYHSRFPLVVSVVEVEPPVQEIENPLDSAPQVEITEEDFIR